jgi:hypothetical protein
MLDRARRLLLAGVVIVPGSALMFGGWAVTTVEDVPEYAVSGRPLELKYTVRQHGMTPLGGLAGKVVVRDAAGLVKNFSTTPVLGADGSYRASIIFDRPGTYEVRINDGFTQAGGQMLPLKVVAAGPPVPAPMSAYDRGHQLYLAKGCATCHSHELTIEMWTSKAGPDLSEPKFAASYLTRFLTDPSTKKDWKTANRMPNLGLKPAEVTALIAFLNQDRK